ncbi:hypothetical protein [Nocardia sp. NPDC019302]
MARELAGGHHIGPITLTLQWLVTKGHVRSVTADQQVSNARSRFMN